MKNDYFVLLFGYFALPLPLKYITFIKKGH